MVQNNKTLPLYFIRLILILFSVAYSALVFSAAKNLSASNNNSLDQTQTLSLEIKEYLLSTQYQQALPLLKKAAKQNNSLAQYQLALFYLKGHAVKKSPSQAEHWLRLSAEKNAKASYLLGSIYAQGRIMPKDLIAAKQYLKLSKAQGGKKAKRLYQKLFTTNNIPTSSKQLQLDLKAAIIESNLKHIITLYKQGVNLKDYINKKQTPLMLALINKQEDIALWIIKTLYADHNSSAKKHPSNSLISTINPYWEIKDNLGNTALHFAIKYNQANAVSLLIRYGVNINAIGQYKQTPLILAVLNNERLIAQYLINEGAITSLKDKNNNTALFYAKQLKMELVISKGEKTQKNRGFIDFKKQEQILKLQAMDKQSPYFGWPILAIAVAQKQKTLISILLNQKHNPWQENLQHKTAITIAIKQKQTELALRLLSFSNVKEKDNNKKMALKLSNAFYTAIKYNNLKIIKRLLLLTKSINLNVLSVEKFPLWQAIVLKNIDAFVVIARELPAKNREDNQQRTALLLATELNLTKISLLLIAMKVDVNSVNKKSRNALWYAAENSNNDLIESLLYAKSSMDIVDKQGHTALTRSVIQNCLDCTITLLNAGADAQKQTKNANNAFLFAAQANAEILQYMLNFDHQSKQNKKLKIKQRNKQSLTPLMLAIIHDNNAGVKLLLNVGANPKRKNDKGENSFDLAKNKPSILTILNKN